MNPRAETAAPPLSTSDRAAPGYGAGPSGLKGRYAIATATGLRPALDPRSLYGPTPRSGTARTSGPARQAARRWPHTSKIPTNQVSTVLGDCHSRSLGCLVRCRW